MRALRRDFIGVPFAGGFRHRIDLGDVDDGAGSVGWVRPLVENVDLVADLGIDFLRLVAADKDAAIGLFVGPELGPDLEILVGGFGDQVGGILAFYQLVGGERAVFHRPIGFAD